MQGRHPVENIEVSLISVTAVYKRRTSWQACRWRRSVLTSLVIALACLPELKIVNERGKVLIAPQLGVPALATIAQSLSSFRVGRREETVDVLTFISAYRENRRVNVHELYLDVRAMILLLSLALLRPLATLGLLPL